MKTCSKNDRHWLEDTLEAVRFVGFAIVVDVLPPSLVEEVRGALYRAYAGIRAELGEERLIRAGEMGTLRLMMKFEPCFFRLLEVPAALAVLDATIGDTAILHTQNGFILPAFPKNQPPDIFQYRFHRDFPRCLNSYLASINTLFAIDPFTAENGATQVVPGSHQRDHEPGQEYMRRHAVPVECPTGSMVVFDSTLWHAAGVNSTERERLGVNHQFTRSWIKQQIDYIRALGDATVLRQAPRTQQLLGWYTRVVTSLDEYYRPEAERLYRKGQG